MDPTNRTRFIACQECGRINLSDKNGNYVNCECAGKDINDGH